MNTKFYLFMIWSFLHFYKPCSPFEPKARAQQFVYIHASKVEGSSLPWSLSIHPSTHPVGHSSLCFTVTSPNSSSGTLVVYFIDFWWPIRISFLASGTLKCTYPFSCHDSECAMIDFWPTQCSRLIFFKVQNSIFLGFSMSSVISWLRRAVFRLNFTNVFASLGLLAFPL